MINARRVHHLCGWLSLALVLGSIAAACSPGRSCPTGYFKDGNRCRIVKDASDTDADDVDDAQDDGTQAGSDGASAPPSAADGGGTTDAGGDSASNGQPALDASATGDDGASSSDAAQVVADTGTDAASAAMCSPACGPKEACRVEGNTASCACADGYSKCESACLDLQSDPMNCGGCGYACETGLSCKQGTCEQKIRELVLGGNRSCALYEAPNGAYPLKCWGDTTGKLFRDTAMEATSPRSVVGVPVARAVALSKAPTGGMQCVVPPNQDVVRCWGECASGCGNTGAVVTNDAFFDNIAVGVVSITAESDASCGRTGFGTLECWGKLPSSPLLSATTTPTQAELRDKSFISYAGIGGDYGCALKQQSGRVLCWGTNQLGAPPSSTANERSVFVIMEGGAELGDVIAVDVGARRSCAVTSQGALWCWGSNTLGSLGTADRDVHVGAVHVELPSVRQVAVGTFQTCAVVQGGQVYCWGMAPTVGLGGTARGDAEDGSIFTRPVPVPGLADVIEIRSGAGHSCARRRSGQVLCWGTNESGQLGDGTAVTRFSPTPVLGLY